MTMRDPAVLLHVNGVEATYQNAIVALHNVNLTHMTAVVEKLREIGIAIDPVADGVRVTVPHELRGWDLSSMRLKTVAYAAIRSSRLSSTPMLAGWRRSSAIPMNA